MFLIWRFVKRAIENPKIIIPVVALIVVAVILDLTLFSGPSNPLPDPAKIQEVTFTTDPSESTFSELGMERYEALREASQGANRLIHSGTGDLVATLHVQMTNGTMFRAKLYEYGLIQTKDGLFEGADDEKSNRLSSLIYDIGNR
jgi:hypothetical protein